MKSSSPCSARRAGFEFEPRGTVLLQYRASRADEVGGSALGICKCGAYCTYRMLHVTPSHRTNRGLAWWLRGGQKRLRAEMALCVEMQRMRAASRCMRTPPACKRGSRESVSGEHQHHAGQQQLGVRTLRRMSVSTAHWNPRKSQQQDWSLSGITISFGAREHGYNLRVPPHNFGHQKGLLYFTGSCVCTVGRDFSQKPECPTLHYDTLALSAKSGEIGQHSSALGNFIEGEALAN
ncbi:hypothetical protein B0H10DRAFT_1943654 [Mycena sp. CBHHK59/15]|nr:hypothetical protein B0H10DRAFT_1943654 [Mycena sp. CBHHK59/15]